MTVFLGFGQPVEPPPPPSLPSVATGKVAQDLVDDARHYLLSGQNEERNRLAVPYEPGQRTLQFEFDLRGVTAGSTITVGLNSFYVWSANPGAKTAEIEGGQDGSIDAAADAGQTVRVRPKFPDHRILMAINDDLAQLSTPAAGLFAMKTVDVAYVGATIGYDLPGVTDVIGIYSVRYQRSQSRSYRDAPRIKSTDYRLERNETTDPFASGYRIQLFGGGRSGLPVTVSYKAPFSPLTFGQQPVSTTGLPVTAYDLPPMGAALRLMAGREIRRNDVTSQGDTRRADEVPAGAVFGSARGLAAQRERRLQDEASRLQAAYPPLLG